MKAFDIAMIILFFVLWACTESAVDAMYPLDPETQAAEYQSHLDYEELDQWQ